MKIEEITKKLYDALDDIVLTREKMEYLGTFDLITGGKEINAAIEILNKYDEWQKLRSENCK